MGGVCPRVGRAHPRSRGEHGGQWLVWGGQWGSSPLARGTPGVAAADFCKIGLIPARAGNTACVARKFAGSRAHPRSRGEHSTLCGSKITGAGSSPLARGTPESCADGPGYRGLIPARAGNTCVHAMSCRFPRAHPRSRGEHFILSARLLWRMGSSPLARGTPPSVTPGGALIGLIPARAGNTTKPVANMEPPWAHPRSRGEHGIGYASGSCRTGSSPLARGTPIEKVSKCLNDGLIPARAGNTQ